jgi:hypothetical protein
MVAPRFREHDLGFRFDDAGWMPNAQFHSATGRGSRDLGDQTARDARGNPGADRGSAGVGLVRDLHEQQPSDQIDVLRRHGHTIQMTNVPGGRRDHTQNRGRRCFRPSRLDRCRHAHPNRAGRPDSLEPVKQRAIAINLRRRFRSTQPNILRADEHMRVADVDQRGLYRPDPRYVQRIDRRSRRQQSTCGTPGCVGEIDQNTCPRAWDAGTRYVPNPTGLPFRTGTSIVNSRFRLVDQARTRVTPSIGGTSPASIA